MNHQGDKITHSVETQWHFKYLNAAGFTPETLEGTGYVRHYVYSHPNGHRIKACTGVSGDYWVDLKTKEQGYWIDLIIYLRDLVGVDVSNLSNSSFVKSHMKIYDSLQGG